jgi:tetratricopeptide (TPR) repeat protein
VLVLGPSGAGKTSLVQAGLIPALKAGAAPAESGLAISDHVQLDCADMGQSGLLETLASVLLDAEIDDRLLFENTSAASLAQYMSQDLPGLIELLQKRLQTIRLAVFIDRFEAIFRLPHISEQERAVFINVLDQLARSGCVLLVLACRNDFYPHLTAYPALMSMKLRGGHFDLTPPGSADIAQIIRHPAQVAQLRYTVDGHGESLDELLINAAKAGPDTLPLLQYCLQELYRQRSPDGELSYKAYHDMGGLEGAIGARAEQVISELGASQIAALPQLLSRLVLVAEDESTVTSRRVPWSVFSGDDETKLVQALVDAHLFVSDLHGGAPAFGIAHEALLRRWPRVVAWIDEHRLALQTRSRISAQARRWQDSGRKRDMLLPAGTQTIQARQLLATSGFSFSSEERTFITNSLQSERRGERLRLAIMAVVTTLALLAGGLGLVARSAQTQAEAHRTEAEGLMGYMLGEFVDQLRPIGKLDLLDSISKRALAYLSDPAHSDDDATVVAQRARSLQLISEVRISRADPAGASAALLAGRAMLQRQLQLHPSDLELRKSAGGNAFWLGQIHLDQKEWTLAERYFGEYRDHSDQLAAAAPLDMESWMEQSFAHNSLGTVALRRGDIATAANEFSLSVDLKARAHAQKPKDKQLTADLADSLSWLASAQMQQGRLERAESLYARSVALLQQLHEAYPDDMTWVNELASTWSHQSDLKKALGQLAGAHDDARLAHALFTKIVEKDKSNRKWQRNLYTAELRMFDTDTKPPAPEQALSRLEQLQENFSQLSLLEPTHLNLQTLVAKVQYRKAVVLHERRQADAASSELQPALNKLRQLHATVPSDRLILGALIDALLLNADLGRMRAESDALNHCDTVRTLLRPLVSGSSDFLLLAPWVAAHACLNQSEQVERAKKQLETMQYRDLSYLQYLSTHQPKKANS